MKTNSEKITVTSEMVQQFENIFGEQKQLPPTFPMIFYPYFTIHWQLTTPPVLRKQYCTSTTPIEVGNTYECQLNLEVKRSNRNVTFYTETLVVYDQDGKECAKCVSHLFTTSTLRMSK